MTQSDEQPPMLEYGHDVLSRQRLITQAITGAVLSCISSIAITTMVIFICIASPPLGIIIGATILFGVIVLAIKTTANPRYRGWGMGIWIGLGLACLVEGTCFIIASH